MRTEKQAVGIVFSVEKVRDEILAVADDLADWIDQRDPSTRRLTVSTTHHCRIWCLLLQRRAAL